MGMYQKILLAVDLHPSYDEHTTQRAAQFAKEQNAELYIIHVIEGIHAYGATQGYEIILEVEQKIHEEAKIALDVLATKYGIPPNQQILAKGAPKNLVLEHAKSIGVDLIIVGGHGLHGISLLLGSTADGISHKAHCDVLGIRAKE